MEKIQFQCPKCKMDLESPSKIAGENVECPDCKTSVMVPFLNPPRSISHKPAVNVYRKISLILCFLVLFFSTLWLLERGKEKTKTVEVIKEIPKEIIKTVEIPKEIIKTVEVIQKVEIPAQLSNLEKKLLEVGNSFYSAKPVANLKEGELYKLDKVSVSFFLMAPKFFLKKEEKRKSS